MKRFFTILLAMSLLFSPIIQACPTCYGKKLTEQGYSTKQINSQELHNKVLHAMRNEDNASEMVMQFDKSQQPTVVTQKTKSFTPSKQPQHHPRHKIGSSQRAVQYKSAGSL